MLDFIITYTFLHLLRSENADLNGNKFAKNACEFSKTYLTREACYKQWNKIITNTIL